MKSTSLLLTILTLGGALLAASAQAATSPASLLPLYGNVCSALAADNCPAAQTAARHLAAQAAQAHQPKLAAAATAVGQAHNLAAARQAFRTLSTDAIALARQQKGYFILHCPMANADWVQTTRTVANPYLGKKMPNCGVVTEETKG